MVIRSYSSPAGRLKLFAKAGRLLEIRFNEENDTEFDDSYPSQPYEPVLDQACVQLDEYFDGLRQRFDLPIALMGSPFQLKVWSVLLRIPFGKTLGYKDLAALAGDPNAARAVGSANGANPLPIIVPCHRVIAADGTLGGFSGGLDAKRTLLDHERAGAGLFAAAMG